MAGSRVTSHASQPTATLDDHLYIPEGATLTVVPAEVENAEDLEFDESNVIALSKKTKYKVHMCLGITSNMSRSTVSVFATGTGPNLFHTYFLPVKLHHLICPIHDMSLKSASNNPVNIIGKIMLLVWMGNLHIRVQFNVGENIAVPQKFGASLIDRSVKGILPMERRVFFIRSRPVPIISQYLSSTDSLAVLQKDSDAGTDTDNRQHKNAWTLLFGFAKLVKILQNADASILFTTSTIEFIYIAPHAN